MIGVGVGVVVVVVVRGGQVSGREEQTQKVPEVQINK